MPTETTLTFSDHALTLARRTDSITLPLTPQGITQKYFHQALPNPVELENAIQEVEDTLRPAYGHIAGGTLVLHTVELYGLNSFIAFPASFLLLRDTLETGFQRLAALSEGRPTMQDPLPENPNFPAFLLILRELMHHLNFSHLQIRN